MREIKFRAWDKKSGTMLHWGSSIIMIDHQLNIHSIVNNVYMAFDVELMQYTGLKDKNGKEMYEGDVIRCRDGSFPETSLEVVCWDQEEAGFHPMTTHNSFEWGDPQYEVIGNLYENPDLSPQIMSHTYIQIVNASSHD